LRTRLNAVIVFGAQNLNRFVYLPFADQCTAETLDLGLVTVRQLLAVVEGFIVPARRDQDLALAGSNSGR
jgi:hypothetical protein